MAFVADYLSAQPADHYTPHLGSVSGPMSDAQLFGDHLLWSTEPDHALDPNTGAPLLSATTTNAQARTIPTAHDGINMDHEWFNDPALDITVTRMFQPDNEILEDFMPQSTASASALPPSHAHVTHAVSAQPLLQPSSPRLSTRNPTTSRPSIPTNLPDHEIVGIVLSNGITGHDKYNCHIRGCSASFTRLADLKRHNGSRHNRERARFWCPVDGCERSMGQCGRAFPRKDKMVDHLERVHADKVGFGGK